MMAPAAPLSVTEDYRSEPPAGGPTERVRMALVAGSGGQPSRELHALLLRRLRIFTSLMALGSAAYWGLLLRSYYLRVQAGTHDWFAAAVPLLTVGAPLAVAVSGILILWLRPTFSTIRLRAIELLVTATLAAVLLWVMVLEHRSLERAGGNRLNAEIRVYQEALSLRWFCLIILYGALIPNTWRRCAAVVGVMGMSPLVLHAVLSLWVRPVPAAVAWSVGGGLGLWIGLAVGIVVFMSNRIEFLRRQVNEARRLGQYVLKERLGAGGMGEVYLAEHVLLKRSCALKLIRPERAGDPKNLRRFEREVQVTATLTHPNTVQIYDYGHTEDGTFYYVMEYLPGLTLEELVRRYGPLPSGRAIHFLRQVCGALGEAHGRGLIHRDIKPGNVIVCERGGMYDTVKLLDFGLVLPPVGGSDADKLTQEGTVTGTPAYMSPEQAGGQDDLDTRSDIYSVGALAYFLLTGQPPFAGRSGARVLAAHLYEPPAPLTQHRPDVPSDLEAVVLRCLAKQPAQRYADAAALAAGLSACQTASAWTTEEAAGWWHCRADANCRLGAHGVYQERGQTPC